MVKDEASVLSRLVLSANWQGQAFKCYWRTGWRQLRVNVNGKNIKMNTWFIGKTKPINLDLNGLKVSVEFKKLASRKIAIIVLKIEGVILKVQAIALRTGAKVPMSSIRYTQFGK